MSRVRAAHEIANIEERYKIGLTGFLWSPPCLACTCTPFTEVTRIQNSCSGQLRASCRADANGYRGSVTGDYPKRYRKVICIPDQVRTGANRAVGVPGAMARAMRRWQLRGERGKGRR